MEGDVGKFTAERGAIHRITDAVKPFVHPDRILAHALADDIERHLLIGKGAAGDARENGEGIIAREIVAREVEALAREASGVLEDTNGDGSDVCDGNLRKCPCRRERRRVDPFSQLLFREIQGNDISESPTSFPLFFWLPIELFLGQYRSLSKFLFGPGCCAKHRSASRYHWCESH